MNFRFKRQEIKKKRKTKHITSEAAAVGEATEPSQELGCAHCQWAWINNNKKVELGIVLLQFSNWLYTLTPVIWKVSEWKWIRERRWYFVSSQNMMSATTAAAGTVTGCGNNVDEAISVQIRTPRKKISRYKKLMRTTLLWCMLRESVGYGIPEQWWCVYLSSNGSVRPSTGMCCDNWCEKGVPR